MRHADFIARRRRAAGFTLIELMLALSLLAVVLIILFESFHAVATGKQQAESRMKADQEARGLIWMLSRELRGTVFTPLIPSHVLLIGEATKGGSSPMDNLIMSTLASGHRKALQSFNAEDLVTYTAVPNPNHPGWYLLTRAQQSALLLQANPTNIAPTVVVNNLISMHLRYFNGFQWLESWDSTAAPPGQALPQAVAIDLVLGTGGKPTRLSTVVPMPMAIIQR